MNTIHIGDAYAFERFSVVTLWRVQGLGNRWYPTKLAAEAAARVTFPHEDATRRYFRISFKNFVMED